MKATYKNITLAVFALCAVACSQDDDFTTAYLSDPDAARINVQVGTNDITGGFSRSNPIGTEDEQKTFNSGDKIGVSAGSQSAVVYTYAGSVWTPESDKYLKWESNTMNFTAWYPATKSTTDDKNFIPQYTATAETESADHLAELQANDYMTYSGEQNNTNGNDVYLTMGRQMVRIIISSIAYNNQYNAGDNAVEAIAITSGCSKYVDGAWNDENITAQMYKHDGNWYAVLPPTATDKDDETFLSITLNGVTEQLTVKGIPATEAGKSYDYTLTIGKNVATLGSVNVTDWTDGTIPGGEAKEYNYTISGTAAVISEFYSDDESLVERAINEILATESSVTDIVVNTTLTDGRQRALATALSGKAVILYLPQVTTEKLVDDLKNSQNISVICGITDATKTARGDLAMFDGTFIDTDDLDKVSKSNYLKSKVAGVVYWKEEMSGNATLTTDKVMAADFPNCTHGLIVALSDISEKLKWQNTCESVYDKFQNTESFAPTNKSDYASISSDIGANDNINKIFGYNNTKVLRAYNEYCSSNGKSAYIVNPVAKLDEWKKSNKAPENTTGWFLPSEKELFILCREDLNNINNYGDSKNLPTKTEVNASLRKIGGSEFGTNISCWSSTERFSESAFIVSFTGGTVISMSKNNNDRNVRAVCAF